MPNHASIPALNPLRPALLLLLACASLQSAMAAEPTAPRVVVDGRLLVVNGTERIPVGMFGVHASPTTPEVIAEWGVESRRDMVWVPSTTPRRPGQGIPEGLSHYIECFWDRYHPALQVMDPNGWRQRLQTLGTGYGENARGSDWTHRVEFWNEPYLNWASRPGVNYDPKFYEREGVQEGDRVRIRGQAEPTEYLVWRQGHFLVQHPSGNPLDINGYVRGGNFQRDPFSANLMRGAQFGVPFEFQGHSKVARPMLVPYDPTQFERESVGNRWWSGQQNRVWYEQMLVTFGEALKAANPEVQLAAGWGFHFNQGGWAAWRELYKPVLEASMHVIDAVHEHHYGGDTRMVAANYEVVWNWAMANYGKSLEFWNTEAGGQLDPQRPDVVHTGSEGTAMEKARGAATYLLRDVLYLLQWSPDKATARAAHHAHHNGGDEFAFRLLKPLRGRLLSSQPSDRDLWSVASLSDDGELVLALFNDQNEERSLVFSVYAPGGYRLNGNVDEQRIVEREDGRGLAIAEHRWALAQERDGRRSGPLTLAGKSAVVLRLGLVPDSAAPAAQERRQQQFPATDKLATVSVDQPYRTRIAIPAEALGGAQAAHLRLAMISYNGSGGVISINGQTMALTPGNWMHRQDIDPSWLTEDNELVISAEQGSFGIWTAALVVEGVNAIEE